MIELSLASLEFIEARRSEIRVAMEKETWPGDPLAFALLMKEISRASFSIYSEITYNSGIQRMPERKAPEPKKRASIDDIFGAL